MWRIVQIEHIDAVNNLEEIVNVDGIDAFVVGPNDLSGSVGHIGRVTHPDMMPIYDRIGEVMRKYNKVFGVSMGFVPEVTPRRTDNIRRQRRRICLRRCNIRSQRT